MVGSNTAPDEGGSSPNFGQDDEEIWNALIDLSVTAADATPGSGTTSSSSSSFPASDASIKPLLSDLARRFQDDWNYGLGDGGGGGGGGDRGSNNNKEPPQQSYWTSLVKGKGPFNTKYGFEYSDQAVAPIQQQQHQSSISSSSSSSSATANTPAALQTEAGRNHLDAVAAILGLSSERATQVTLGTIRSIDKAMYPSGPSSSSSNSDDDDGGGGGKTGKGTTAQQQQKKTLASLIGTPQFLVQTVMWEYRQRLARMNVVVECLRLEQDDAFHTTSNDRQRQHREAIVEFLNNLDSTFHNDSDGDEGKRLSRGLFRSFVTTVGRSKPQASLAALGPSRKLLTATLAVAATTTARGTGSNSNDATSQDSAVMWSEFCSHMITEQEVQFERERSVALKGLMVLLYERIDGGIRRADYALLLTAFGDDGCHWFMDSANDKAQRTDSMPLSNLFALINAECMALWRFFETSSNGGGGSTANNQHPLLCGSTDQVRKELQNLVTIILSQLQPKVSTTTTDRPLPQSVAALSFGLFLCLAPHANNNDPSQNEEWRNIGSKFVQDSNDDAFGLLDEVLGSFSPPWLTSVGAGRKTRRDPLYEFLHQQNRRTSLIAENDHNDDGEVTMALEDEESTPEMESSSAEQNLSPDTITYTSIAREVVAACISVYADTVLDISQPNSIANIEILCKVMSKVYNGNQPLTDQFWETWRVYEEINDDSTSKKRQYPICALLEASFQLVSEGYEAFSSRIIQQDYFLSSVAPFFQLISTICNAAELTAAIFDTLPKGLIRDIVLSIGSSSKYKTDAAYTQNHRASILQALNILLKQNSDGFVDNARRSLEDGRDDPGSMVEGPKMLGRIIRHEKDRGIITSVLNIMSQMLYGAPRPWVLALYREFADNLMQSSMSTLTSFLTIENSDLSVSASNLLCAFVDSIGAVVRTQERSVQNEVAQLIESLATGLLASVTFLASSRSPSLLASVILRGCSNYLATLQSIFTCQCHSSRVQQAACNGRDILISALSTGTSIGEKISFYATLPVSICVIAKIDELLEQGVLAKELAPVDFFGSSLKTFTGSRDASKVKEMSTFLTSFRINDSLVDEALAKGVVKLQPISSPAIILEAATAAIELLSNWALVHLESLQLISTQNQGHRTELIGPEKLLNSLATAPPEMESSRSYEVWRELGVSNFELLLPYITRSDRASTKLHQPTAPTLNLLCNILQIQSLEGKDDPLFGVRSGCFGHLSSNVIKIAEYGIDIMQQKVVSAHYEEVSHEERYDILCSLLCLQLMSIAANSSLSLVLEIFRVDLSPGLVGLLKDSALAARSLLGSLGPNGDLRTNEKSVILSMATLSIGTLAGLWKAMRWLPSTSSDGVELAKELEGQTTFLVDLAGVVCSFGSAMKEISDVSLIDKSLLQFLAYSVSIIYSEISSGGSGASFDASTMRNLIEACLSFLSRDMPSAYVGPMKSMTSSLSGLALFGVESVNDNLPSTPELSRMLELFAVSVEVCSLNVGTVSDDWKIHENLLSSILLLLGRMGRNKEPKTPPGSANVASIRSTIFFTVCQFLRKVDKALGPDSIPPMESLSTLHLCFSILTDLIPFEPTVTVTLKENDSPRIALSLALRLSKSVYESWLSKNSSSGTQCFEKLCVVKSVLELTFVLADSNDAEVLRTLDCIYFSELVVRNPLFFLRKRDWSTLNTSRQKRGYEIKGGKWSEDPVWVIWIQSIQVLYVVIRTACSRGDLDDQGFAKGAVALANEFLHVHKDTLFVCLKACCEQKQLGSSTIYFSRLDANVIREAKSIVALLAELCKRPTRNYLLPPTKALCDNFVRLAKDVVVSIGRFLGAGARARKLFESEIKAGDVDSLPSGGLNVPDANYQGILYSNFSHDRSEPTTKEDMEKAKIVPSYLGVLGEKQEGEQDFIIQCRMFVANQFTIDLEALASECLSVALSLIWRTHAVSRSMHELQGDRMKGDAFVSLVSVGTVISFQTPVWFVADTESTRSEGVIFGRVLNVDTVSRRVEVSILSQNRRIIVNADWIVGIEDKMSRKPSTTRLDCAPESAENFCAGNQAEKGLSTGTYLVILEWIQYQASKESSSSLDMPPHLLKQISEQTTVLLGADIVLHQSNGDFSALTLKESQVLASQVFNFYADASIVDDNIENDGLPSNFPEGSMKNIVDDSVWQSIQEQVRPIMSRAWKDRMELEATNKKRRDSFSSTFRSHQFGW